MKNIYKDIICKFVGHSDDILCI